VGIEGHADLFTHRMSGSVVQFKCRACNFLWNRDYTADGTFVWTASSGDFFGSNTPGWQQPER
jgi:hypothetical protein